MIRFPLRRFFTRLMLSYLMVTLAVLGVISIIFVTLMQRYFFSVEGWQLAGRGEKAAELLKEPLLEQDLPALTRLTETLAFSYDAYLWVTDRTGTVLVNSGNNPDKLGLRVEQNEIQHVLAGNVITKQITGPGYNSLFYMAPVYEPGYDPNEDQEDESDPDGNAAHVVGALAISFPMGPLFGTIAEVTRLGIYAAFGAAALAALIGYTLSRRIAYPIEEMSKVALELSEGRFEKRASYRSDDELGKLAVTLNYAVERVSETIEEQRRTVKLQRDLISDISHEFRAPLTSLRGFLELMQSGKIKPEEKNKYLEIMHEDTLHLSRLVQDLLDLASLESHQFTLHKVKHDLDALLRTSIQHLQLAAAAKGAAIEIQSLSDTPPVEVDENRFHQVIVNLVENAVRYSPPGGKVIVKAGAHQGGALVEVIDSGAGIPEAELPFIWNRFYKVDKARTRVDTGSGLGLAIVRQIVELHGGRVAVESSPGKGSTFSFWLPTATD
ncbi:MAG: HAMP domain-containing sensor histidine kinase [Bacillota bacterium]